jgi:hypothetical protein
MLEYFEHSTGRLPLIISGTVAPYVQTASWADRAVTAFWHSVPRLQPLAVGPELR